MEQGIDVFKETKELEKAIAFQAGKQVGLTTPSNSAKPVPKKTLPSRRGR